VAACRYDLAAQGPKQPSLYLYTAPLLYSTEPQ